MHNISATLPTLENVGRVIIKRICRINHFENRQHPLISNKQELNPAMYIKRMGQSQNITIKGLSLDNP